MFKDIFKDGYSNYTFYAHNTGKFDSHFIVNSLLIKDNEYDNYEVKLIVGDNNEIIELAIKRKKEKGKVSYKEKQNYGTVRIHDSYKFIPESLNSIAKDMLNLKGKDIFPHSFVNKNTIDYKGLLPENKYFKNLNKEDYLQMADNHYGIWSTKDNCLNYLQTDLDILYDAMIMFGQTIWHEYGINLRQRKTISGLALLIYQSNYLNKSKCKIPLIRGGLEKYFRSAYYGGNVNIKAHHCDKGFIYDMNSQYPNAMLQNLPVGDNLKLMSISKDKLKDCFGIVYAEVQSPKMVDLRVPILPRRFPNGQIEIPHNSK
jgi:DNA polymerase type B, organellar and viral